MTTTITDEDVEAADEAFTRIWMGAAYPGMFKAALRAALTAAQAREAPDTQDRTMSSEEESLVMVGIRGSAPDTQGRADEYPEPWSISNALAWALERAAILERQAAAAQRGERTWSHAHRDATRVAELAECRANELTDQLAEARADLCRMTTNEASQMQRAIRAEAQLAEARETTAEMLEQLRCAGVNLITAANTIERLGSAADAAATRKMANQILPTIGKAGEWLKANGGEK